MQTAVKQQGMTAISMLLLLIIGAFFALLAMKLGPIYLENYKVKTVLANLESQPNMASLPSSKIRSAVTNRLYINEVRRLDNKNIKIKRVGQVIEVKIDYAVREKIFANVEAVVSFQEKAELKAH
jgi:hypothetical protein